MFPNPFLGHTKIYGTQDEVEIYNLSGRLVERTNSGIWDGRGLDGNEVKSGIYFLKADGKYVGKVVKVR